VGYKYDGLVLQVGGWVTGREPITIKKLAVRKPEMWPHNSQTKCNRPRHWNERSKTDDWEKSIKEANFRIRLYCHQRRRRLTTDTCNWNLVTRQDIKTKCKYTAIHHKGLTPVLTRHVIHQYYTL